MSWDFHAYEFLTASRIQEWTREAERDRLARAAAAGRRPEARTVLNWIGHLLGPKVAGPGSRLRRANPGTTEAGECASGAP